MSPFSLEPRPDDVTLPLTCPYVFKNPPLIPLKVLIDAVLYVDILAEETQGVAGRRARVCALFAQGLQSIEEKDGFMRRYRSKAL